MQSAVSGYGTTTAEAAAATAYTVCRTSLYTHTHTHRRTVYVRDAVHTFAYIFVHLRIVR